MNSINKWNFVVDMKQIINAVKAMSDNFVKFIDEAVNNIRNIFKRSKVKVKKCKDAP